MLDDSLYDEPDRRSVGDEQYSVDQFLRTCDILGFHHHSSLKQLALRESFRRRGDGLLKRDYNWRWHPGTSPKYGRLQ